MSAGFKDLFSSVAASYAAFRPTYPQELGDYLASLVTPGTGWDAGCGPGQLSKLLVTRFEKVIATDASAEQLKQATPDPRILYRQAKAEDSGIESNSVDLATAAQAAHWFDLPAYYNEVRRVVKPGGVIAIIGYPHNVFDEPALEAVHNEFYRNTLKPYWPPERQSVAEGYRTLSFPFEEIQAPSLPMEADWDCTQFIGYLETWSATRFLQKSPEAEKWPDFVQKFAAAWGDAKQKRRMRWPSFMRVGRV